MEVLYQQGYIVKKNIKKRKINDEAVCKTAPATPGLLKMCVVNNILAPFTHWKYLVTYEALVVLCILFSAIRV